MSVPTMSVQTALEAAAVAAGRKEWDLAANLLADQGEATEVLDKRSFYLSRAKRYDEALELLAILRTREPQSFLWSYMTAYQFYDQERYREAVPWFREAIRRNPKHVKSWWRAANALSKGGEDLKAVQCAARVLRLWHDLPDDAQERERPSFGKASYFLGKHQMRSDPHGAVELLKQALAVDPRDPHRQYMLGKALRYDARPAEALPHLREAAKLKGGDTNIELELAVCLSRTAAPEEADRIVRKLEPRLRGWNLLKAGDLALALERPRLAVSLLERAKRDRATSANDRVSELLARAQEEAKIAPPEVTSPEAQPASKSAEVATGRVDMVNEERNFGFLVDESGTRRHFRLGELRVRRGQQVRFEAFDGKKGPAARELAPL